MRAGLWTLKRRKRRVPTTSGCTGCQDEVAFFRASFESHSFGKQGGVSDVTRILDRAQQEYSIAVISFQPPPRKGSAFSSHALAAFLFLMPAADAYSQT